MVSQPVGVNLFYFHIIDVAGGPAVPLHAANTRDKLGEMIELKVTPRVRVPKASSSDVVSSYCARDVGCV